MIKSSELRIGNLVMFLTYDETSDGNLVGESYVEKIENAAGISHVEEFPDSYDPILLTEEWLERMGFVAYGTGWRIGTYWFKIEPECAGVKGFYFRSIEAYMRRLDYVHQLQNLYFALTGEELEVKL